jgi:hypothetical protein
MHLIYDLAYLAQYRAYISPPNLDLRHGRLPITGKYVAPASVSLTASRSTQRILPHVDAPPARKFMLRMSLRSVVRPLAKEARNDMVRFLPFPCQRPAGTTALHRAVPLSNALIIKFGHDSIGERPALHAAIADVG